MCETFSTPLFLSVTVPPAPNQTPQTMKKKENQPDLVNIADNQKDYRKVTKNVQEHESQNNAGKSAV
jgi:hypothetical protein